MRSVPAEGPFILLGESFSGPLALTVGAARPPRLQAIVLCASFVHNPFWVRAPWLRHLVPAFAFRLYPCYSKAKALLSSSSTAELRASSQQAIAAVRPEVLAHRVREAMRVNVSDELSRCMVPNLYLRGTRDVVVPRHNSYEIAQLSGHVTQATIAAPHMVLQTRPREAAEAISRFIAASVPSE